jgi:hypothetical protein
MLNLSRWLALVLPVLSVMVIHGCATNEGAGITKEGLQRLDVEMIEYVAIHPGADLASFSDIYIEPVELEFRSGWRPQSTGSHLSVSPVRLKELQEKLQAMFMDEFKAGLSENSRLRIVNEATPEVLRITPRIVNVTVTNLDGKANPGQTFARKQGEAKLEMTIRDVRTGTLVVRVEDRRVIANSADGFAVTGAGAIDQGFARIFSGWGAFTGKGILNVSPVPAESR